MIATRRGRLASGSAIDGGPFYHDDCWEFDDRGFSEPDAKGRPTVWWPNAWGGDRAICSKCKQLIKVGK